MMSNPARVAQLTLENLGIKPDEIDKPPSEHLLGGFL